MSNRIYAEGPSDQIVVPRIAKEELSTLLTAVHVGGDLV
jgi:hypothetical protein